MPRVRSIHQIEITSRCNLACVYCTNRSLKRPKMDILPDVFIRALEWAQYFAKAGTQTELNLAGIGESTLHPKFVELVALARSYMGPGVRLTMATNGILMTPELAKAIAPYKPEVWVSLHRPEKAGPAVEALKSAGILSGISIDPSVASIDWAGQVDWAVTAAPMMCQWIPKGRVMVMADGNVTACCLDADRCGVVGNVFEDISSLETEYFKLCETCSFIKG